MRLLDRSLLHVLWIATALRVLIPSTADPDLWGHLLFGSILLGGTVPATNGFGYTAASHPWINHELLAEMSMAAAYRALGSVGLVGLKVALGVATLAIVERTAARRSHSAWAAAAATCVAAVTMLPGLMIRPQLFTLCFLAIVLHVLARTRHRARGAAWALPMVVVVWTNTHGGVAAGVGLAAAGLVAAALATGARASTWRARASTRAWESAHGRSTADPADSAARMRRRARRALIRAALLVALLAAATCVNPYGVGLPRFLLVDVTPRVAITEWAAVDLADASFPLFKITLVALAAWLALARRARAPEMAIVGATAAAALLHRRHIPLFAIAAAPLVAAALADLGRRARAEHGMRRWIVRARPIVAAAAGLQAAAVLATTIAVGGRIAVPDTYPLQALRFLADNGITGNVALPFDWGELALWSLPAGSRVAVDGRFTTAYPQRVLDEAWRFMRGDDGWDDLLERHPTDVVVSARSQPTTELLRARDDWVYVYSDPVAVVFIRRTAAQASTLARLATGALRYDRTPFEREFPALARAADALPRGRRSSATVASAWTDS